MNERFNFAFFNRLMYYGLTLLIGALIVFILSAVGVLSLIISLAGALLPVFIAIGVAVLMESPIRFLGRYKVRRGIAVIISYFTLAAIIVVALIFLVPVIIKQSSDFATRLPELLHQVEKIIYDLSKGSIVVDLGASLKGLFSTYSREALSYLASALSVFYTITIAITGAVFLSLDFPYFKKQVKAIIPLRWREIVYPFFHDFVPVTNKYISAVLLNAFLLFVYSSFIFFLIGVPFPLIFGLIVGLTKLIPVIGSYLGSAPVVIAGLAISWQKGVIFLIVVMAIQFVESNFIAPIIVRNRMKIKAIENLLAVALLGSLFGFIGMIIAPIIVSGIKIAIYQRQLRRNKLDPTLVDPGEVSQIDQRKEKRLNS